jgi:hypothetical protein
MPAIAGGVFEVMRVEGAARHFDEAYHAAAKRYDK